LLVVRFHDDDHRAGVSGAGRERGPERGGTERERDAVRIRRAVLILACIDRDGGN
jgi:hypothetical protein